jgi:hypothetical protein
MLENFLVKIAEVPALQFYGFCRRNGRAKKKQCTDKVVLDFLGGVDSTVAAVPIAPAPTKPLLHFC